MAMRQTMFQQNSDKPGQIEKCLKAHDDSFMSVESFDYLNHLNA